MPDAEGRLTLADALVYAEKEVEADIVIDLATLTGASMIALGENIGSLFSSSQNLADVSDGIHLLCNAAMIYKTYLCYAENRTY